MPKYEGEIFRTEPGRNGFVIRRDEDGAEFIFFPPRPQNNNRQVQGSRQWRVGDLVSFEVQNARGVEDRAVNVTALHDAKALNLEWEFVVVPNNLLAITITPTRGNRTPTGLKLSLRADGVTVKAPVEISTDGSGPIEFEASLPANTKSAKFVLTVRETGKKSLTFSKVWRPASVGAKDLKVVEKAKVGDKHLFFISPISNTKKGAAFQDIIGISANNPVHVCFLTQGKDKKVAKTEHLYDTGSAGFLNLLIYTAKGVKESVVYFFPQSNPAIMQGPFTVSAPALKPVELDIKVEQGEGWMNCEITPMVEGKASKLDPDYSLKFRSKQGSVLAARKAGEIDWETGSEIEYGLKEAIRFQVKVESLAEVSLIGEHFQVILEASDGSHTEYGWFYIQRKFCGSAKATTA